MTHLFKVQLQHSDLFISAIDPIKCLISYEVRDKKTGLLLEPSSFSKFEVLEDKISFDKRQIPIPIVQQIVETLND